MTADLPEKRIEPIELDATKAGPGDHVVGGTALGLSGKWTVEVIARVSDFDEYRKTTARTGAVIMDDRF